MSNSPVSPLSSYNQFFNSSLSLSLCPIMTDIYNSTAEMDEQDETEETLSFCDLPIYSSDAADWDKFSKEDESLATSSSSTSDQGFFEFFSEDRGNSTSSYPAQNIVFCGKLIPSEKPVHIKPTNNREKEKPKSRFPFPWKSNWFSKQKGPKNQTEVRISRSKSVPENLGRKVGKSGKKNGFSFRRLWILDSPVKLLVFGFGIRVPAEMQLRDIKSRQSKRKPPTGLFSGRDGKRGEKLCGGKGLWTMIGALGCGGGGRWNVVEEFRFGIVPSARAG